MMNFCKCRNDSKYLFDEFYKLVEAGYTIKVSRIKEKFSSLRIYLEEISDEIAEVLYSLIEQTEVKSRSTCSACGIASATSKITYRGESESISNRFLFSTLCKDCRNGNICV